MALEYSKSSEISMVLKASRDGDYVYKGCNLAAGQFIVWKMNTE